MDIKDLPGANRKFSLRASRPGRKSFKSKLGKLARKNYRFRNLNKENVNTIVGVLDKPGVKKAIRLKGGISDYQRRKKVVLPLYKEWKKHRDTFTKSDLNDGKKIAKYLSKREQDKLKTVEQEIETPPRNIVKAPPLPLPEEEDPNTIRPVVSIYDAIKNKANRPPPPEPKNNGTFYKPPINLVK